MGMVTMGPLPKWKTHEVLLYLAICAAIVIGAWELVKWLLLFVEITVSAS